jgi:hypothetical protein
VRVGVERDARLAVAQSLANRLDRRAGLKQKCRVGVPQIVQANPRHARAGDDCLVIAVEVARVQWLAPARAKHQIVFAPLGRRQLPRYQRDAVLAERDQTLLRAVRHHH